MADTSVRIDEATKNRLAALAADRGMSLRSFLAELSREEENRQHLTRATVAFRTAIERDGFADAFDRDFGGTPASAPNTRRAA
ncbi:antitoxin MazE7 [Streptomyces gobiensis]|uniref:antitoxin MazE7 n=1 Tax=Streptomyces gobiensis TaxID=2875706 RepID=UPI001E433894|nr:antitoxin MazE7 [Streptomyces gobiensis]UGY93314.1 antitoxin MazE7 [Streptomyces gobiensis]